MFQKAQNDISQLLYQAIESRDTGAIATMLDDDIEWAIFGPIDMFPCFGARRGKDAALGVLKQIGEKFQLHKMNKEYVIAGENASAALTRWTLTPANDTKRISVRVSKFARFDKGKITSLHAMIDALDLVEQILGEEIRLPSMTV